MIDEINQFATYLSALDLPSEPTDAQLKAVAQRLISLANASSWNNSPYRAANPHEELLYELAISANDGPSLYLVSDGQSVSSPPHEHKTWAVIVGIRGTEINRIYEIQSVTPKVVCSHSSVEIGPGEALIMRTHEVHSTEVTSSYASFHLHLYGQPLHTLPSFDSRRFSIACGA